ncbi:uncharacterized protein METZ01_LOCUS479725 [marine metagenome]|uniref:DUF559 domain-containing protein n=1 Tax=marine metagenome TaxID=408172 RepID=A0A383C3X4_9ZZZZ
MTKKISKKTRSYIMSKIRGKDTKIEVTLREALWKEGYRYRKNDRSVFGSPDICFKGKKVAVFCDSAFWHGKDYLNGRIPSSNQAYWVKKLERNITRDKEVNRVLKADGWKVIRFWEEDINADLSRCVYEVGLLLDQVP